MSVQYHLRQAQNTVLVEAHTRHGPEEACSFLFCLIHKRVPKQTCARAGRICTNTKLSVWKSRLYENTVLPWKTYGGHSFDLFAQSKERKSISQYFHIFRMHMHEIENRRQC